LQNETFDHVVVLNDSNAPAQACKITAMANCAAIDNGIRWFFTEYVAERCI
jgi:hypothetical protein